MNIYCHRSGFHEGLKVSKQGCMCMLSGTKEEVSTLPQQIKQSHFEGVSDVGQSKKAGMFVLMGGGSEGTRLMKVS